jgi:hypothetical protein
MERSRYRQPAAAALAALVIGLAAASPVPGTEVVALNPGPCGSAERQAQARTRAVTERRIPVVGRRDFRDGNRVDYRALVASPAWREHRREIACLRFFDPGSLAGAAERTAFWINTYNSLVVDGVIARNLPASVRDVEGFFQHLTYDIGGVEYSLDQIEAGLGKVEPRIHFALVCAARSCPRLEAYAPERLEAQLDSAARAFLNRTTRPLPGDGGLEVSAVLQWYVADFGGRAGVIETLHRHLEPGPTRRLLEAVPSIPLSYAAFDWRLNDAS